jgi:hypothetical protein
MANIELFNLYETWVSEKKFTKKKKNVCLGKQNILLTLNFDGYISELIHASFIESTNTQENFSLSVFMPDCFDDLLLSLSSHFTNPTFELPYLFSLTTPFRLFISSEQGSIYLYNVTARHGLIFLRNSDTLDQRSFVTPFRLMLSWMADETMAEVLHASAFSKNENALLISGKKGSGKSTLALVAALNGFNIIADDAVLVENGIVFALYSRAKIEESNSFTSRYLEKTFSLMNNKGAKQILPLSSLGPTFDFSARVKHIVFPTRSEKSNINLASNEKFKPLFLEDSLREIFGGNENNMTRQAQIYDSYLNFELQCSTDMERNLNLLGDLLSL